MDAFDLVTIGLDSAHLHLYNIAHRTTKNFFYLLTSFARQLNRFGLKCVEIKEGDPSKIPDFLYISEHAVPFPLDHSFDLLFAEFYTQKYTKNLLDSLFNHFGNFTNSWFNRVPFKHPIVQKLWDIQFHCAAIVELLKYCALYRGIAENHIKTRYSGAVSNFLELTCGTWISQAEYISTKCKNFCTSANFHFVQEIELKDEKDEKFLSGATIRYLTNVRRAPNFRVMPR